VSLYPIPALIFEIIQDMRARHPGRPALVGVSGAQGSGKTHWCSLLEATNRPRFAHFSLDDVYLTKEERQARAKLQERAIFGVRGAPGTHDLTLAGGMIARLGKALATPLPRFDKRADDRAPEETWPVFQGPAEAILIDGWCLGAHAPEADDAPLNPIEEIEDGDGYWREAVRTALAGRYAAFFAAFDAIVYLKAPSWEIVRRWRGEQEEKALGRPLTPAENAALDRFVMHYERVTRSMLAGAHDARWIVHLDEARNLVRVEERA
jgi:D-glycerate 3-kinase